MHRDIPESPIIGLSRINHGDFAGGELYSMGDITSRIHNPSSENYTPRFVKVDLGEVIEAMACGDSHGLILTREKVRLFHSHIAIWWPGMS